jgi:hypothetical protein
VHKIVPEILAVQALRGLKSRLGEMLEYLTCVLEGKLPANNDIIALMQDIFNLLPNLNVQSLSQSLAGAIRYRLLLDWWLAGGLQSCSPYHMYKSCIPVLKRIWSCGLR